MQTTAKRRGVGFNQISPGGAKEEQRRNTKRSPHFLNLPTTYITIDSTTLNTTEVASGK